VSPPSYIQQEIEKEKRRAQQRLTLYRQYAPLPELKDHTVILVDDGIATGATMLTTIQAMRKAQVQRVVLAVPVAATSALELMKEAADEVFCLYDREDFSGVGLYYQHFQQTDDAEIIDLLKNLHKI
jgi:putative phosphoribosyl transferase